MAVACRPTKAAVPDCRDAGLCRCPRAIGRTTPISSRLLPAKTPSCTAGGRPTPAATAAAAAATASIPSTKVSVSISATPSTAAAINQSTQSVIRAESTASGRRCPSGERTDIVLRRSRCPTSSQMATRCYHVSTLRTAGVPETECADRRCGGGRRGRMHTMTRWRAVPTTVWTAVGALAFLASCGLAVVLGAGLHVSSGPLPTTATHSAPGSARLARSGVVTVKPPAPTSPTAPRAGGPATTPPEVVVLPFVPFAPASGGSGGLAAPTPAAPGPPAQAPSAGGGTPLTLRSAHDLRGHDLGGHDLLRAARDDLLRAAGDDGLRARGHGGAHLTVLRGSHHLVRHHHPAAGHHAVHHAAHGH